MANSTHPTVKCLTLIFAVIAQGVAVLSTLIMIVLSVVFIGAAATLWSYSVAAIVSSLAFIELLLVVGTWTYYEKKRYCITNMLSFLLLICNPILWIFLFHVLGIL
jgi:hypothetical protein